MDQCVVQAAPVVPHSPAALDDNTVVLFPRATPGETMVVDLHSHPSRGYKGLANWEEEYRQVVNYKAQAGIWRV